MIEIFTDIAPDIKYIVQQYINDIFNHNTDPMKIATLANVFRNKWSNLNIRAFIDFYFKLKMEELRNGDNNNQR